MEFSFVNAPFECREDPPRELQRFLTSPEAKFKSWLRFHEQRSETTSPDCVYGLEEVCRYLADILKNQGPFDGILAFSQGGIIYRHFYRITQEIDPEAYQDKFGNPLFTLPKFAVMVASPVFPKMKFMYKN